MLERGERAHDHRDFVTLDQFDRLGLGARGIAAGVRHHHVDLAARQSHVAVAQEGGDAFLAVDAAGSERSGLDGKDADLERRALRDRRHRE
jgi:hypothetical protein